MIETYSVWWWIYSAIATILWGGVFALSIAGYVQWLGGPWLCEPFTEKEKAAQRSFGI